MLDSASRTEIAGTDFGSLLASGQHDSLPDTRTSGSIESIALSKRSPKNVGDVGHVREVYQMTEMSIQTFSGLRPSAAASLFGIRRGEHAPHSWAVNDCKPDARLSVNAK